MFYYFDELPSTIDEARDEKYVHGDVVLAEHQTAGRGQRGKQWSSEAGKNLMLSVVLDTSFLLTTEQFLLLQVVALALTDAFADYGLDSRIKWTNDIYIGDRKITGVLIDHTLGKDGMMARSGVGVGINVNQTEFDEWLPNPTSMALELGCEVDRHEVLEKFYSHLTARFYALRADAKGGERKKTATEYHSKVYRLDAPALYELPDGTKFTGKIRGVAGDGELRIEHSDGSLKSYLFREIGFVI